MSSVVCWILMALFLCCYTVVMYILFLFFFFSSRRRHTSCALVTGVQTCALPILELKISYIRGLSSDSGTVRAVGRVTAVGRRVAFAEATLHDGAGRLCATATSTLLIFPRG